MHEEFSFEEKIREKISGIRLHPSDKVWDVLNHNLSRTFHPGLHYPVLFLLLNIFIFSSLRISHHSGYLFTGINKYYSYSDISSIEHSAHVQNRLDNTKKPKDELSYRLMPVGHVNSLRSAIEINEDIIFKKIGNDPTVLNAPLAKKGDSIVRDIIMVSAPSKSVSDFIKTQEAHRDPAEQKEAHNALQFYFAPSFTYRLLRETEKMGGSNAMFTNDSSAFYMPSVGLEAGFALWKPINKKWAIKGGFLVNMSVFEMKAASNMDNIETAKSGKVPTSNEFKNEKNQVSSGAKLMNQNFRFSIPIEIEYKLAGNQTVSFFMSGSLQPSFSIYNTSGNVITSSFKDHIPVDPYLYRRFNVLTGLECFFRFNAGTFDIQMGPQIRYQLLSNNVGASPYKEHLMDYSMKIGIIKKIN